MSMFGSYNDNSNMELKLEVDIKDESFEISDEYLCKESESNYESMRHQELVSKNCTEVLSLLEPRNTNRVKIEVTHDAAESLREMNIEDRDCQFKPELDYEYIEDDGLDIKMEIHEDAIEYGNCKMMNYESIRNHDSEMDEGFLFHGLEELEFSEVAIQNSNSSSEKNFADMKIEEQVRNLDILESYSPSSSRFGNINHINKDLKNKGNEGGDKFDVGSRQGIKFKEAFECSLCGFKTKLKSTFKGHLLTHSHTKLFKCSECDYECNRKNDLKLHLLTHSNTKLFKCSECDYKCNRKGDLKKHSVTHLNTKSFKCSECDYECNRKGDLKKHSLTHSNTKLFKCFECDYECNRKDSLKFHLLTHSNTKLFKCSECDYECNKNSNLKRHLLNHSNSKLFSCSECGYECNQNGHFKTHLLTHSNAKQFKCIQCNYKCNLKSSLKRHLLTHSNTKLFKCSKCDYKCNRKGYLKVHFLIHSNIKLFKCSECDFKCNHKSNLRKHLLTHSKVQIS